MKLSKTVTGALAACVAVVMCLTSCSSSSSLVGRSESENEITVAAIETAYGQDGWQAVARAFEAQTGIKVNLIMDKNLEDVIGPQMKAHDYPDVIHLALGREAGLPETMIRDKALADITDVLDMTIPGEQGTVRDKLTPGIETSNATAPYSNGRLYLAPMFYSPTGLYYNATLFRKKGWKVPTTWDEMWKLGEVAKKDGIDLFGYSTAGYMDALFYALAYEVGGQEFFDKVSTYAEGVWDTPEGQTIYDIMAKIAERTASVVPAQANQADFTKNQQLLMDDKVLFMPNGTWVVDEMADAPRSEGFEWAVMPLPALTKGGDRYTYTFIEEAWIPAKALKVEKAKQFLAFLYSDTAVQAFATAAKPAFQPVKDVFQYMDKEDKVFYSMYDKGAKAAVGNMATTDSTTNWKDAYLFPIDSVASGNLTEEEWLEQVKKANDILRHSLVE